MGPGFAHLNKELNNNFKLNWFFYTAENVYELTLRRR